jgi:hypothetical protein
LEFFPQDLQDKIVRRFQKELKLFRECIESDPLNANELQDILNFKNNQLTLFAVLPNNRNYLGKLLVRNSNGEFAKDSAGNIWSIPILAKSGRGLNFTHSNGQTPLGVYTVEGVMPEANKNFEFGSFRRLIVNFIPKSLDEENIINLLPKSHITKSWWKQSVVGRDLGRSLLRIHGTGRKNRNLFSEFYPLVPTSGCIATNEAKFPGFSFSDQRKLLDVLMAESNLEINFSNEEKICGILYVLECNDSFDKIHIF